MLVNAHQGITMKRLWATVLLCALAAGQMRAQFPEDALRLAQPGMGVGVRALGMGGAYTGVANDFSAVYWNPAGLGQMTTGEFSGGFRYLHQTTTSSFLGNSEDYSSSATDLNSIGLAIPTPVRQGAFVIGFGFTRQANFASGLSYGGFNPAYSAIQNYAPNGQPAGADWEYGLANALGFTELDNQGRYITPIDDSLDQSAVVTEDGGLNNWSLAAAIDIARNLSLGGTLTYVAGSYGYERKYEEQDNAHIYEQMPDDLKHWTLTQTVHGDISGITGKMGLLYRIPDLFRLGIAVKFPTRYYVKEDFGERAESFFDNGDILPPESPYQSTGYGEYDVVTPWVLSAGMSLILLTDMPSWLLIHDIVVSGDVDLTDWTTMRFDDATPDVMAWNSEMNAIFRPTMNLRLGAEVGLFAPFRVRAGIQYVQSPYKDDGPMFDSPYDRWAVTAGFGVLLGSSVMLDLAYVHGWWENFRENDVTSIVYESTNVNNGLLSISYRF